MPRVRRPAAPLLVAPLLAAALLAGCGAPVDDADGDGLDDVDETTPKQVNVRAREGNSIRMVVSDPAVKDTDGDGMSDHEEALLFTDPRDIDTDGDGLLDGPDLPAVEGTPLWAEAMARNITRDEARGVFLGEKSAGTKPFDWDGDRPFPDGLADGEELAGWDVVLAQRSYRSTSDPGKPDTDGDALNDLEERRRGCDPRSGDADGDGAPDPADADCNHDVHVSIAVGRIDLARPMDPAGGADLLLIAQAAGEVQEHRQALREGATDVTFRWVLDVPDGGPWRQLRVPVVLEFWDEDLAGDDAESGVQRQPLRLAGDHHVLHLELDVFERRWTSSQGVSAGASAEVSGTDGSVRLTLLPMLR